MNPFYKNLALWMVIGLIVILLFNLFQAKESPRDEIVFSDFLKKVETGEVREVTLRGNSVSGKLANGEDYSRSDTAACRASTDPATTSGRNGWYVMYGRGSTTTTSASPRRSFFSSRHAV